MNNRIIKFRAWDKKLGYIAEVLDIDFEDNELMVKCKEWDLASVYGGKIETFKLMQYTGLSDKNGVEIYEGDIVKIDDSIMRVEYLNGCFDIVGINIHLRDYLGEQMRCYGDEIEVIGNIHESPELLETK